MYSKAYKEANVMSDTNMMVIPVNDSTETRIQVSNYRGESSVDFRQYFYPDDSEEAVPTKKGVKIPLEDLPRVIQFLQGVQS
jgi:hypothetical protein